MTEDFLYPSSHKFVLGSYVKTVNDWPVKISGFVYNRGQRFGKDKKGNPVFEQNSYLIADVRCYSRIHYFLESELTQ